MSVEPIIGQSSSLSDKALSTSKLWATASKEWVIPAKPKPGRKPKKDTSLDVLAVKEDEDVDSSGRRVQNRAAQRAFRERKQTQLAELQARLHMYEQGEIERNVALQTIAKRLKEENDELRRENQTLKEKIAIFEKDQDPSVDKKRSRNDTPAPSTRVSSENSSRKKAKVDADSSVDLHQSNSLRRYESPSSSMVSSPGTAYSGQPLSNMNMGPQRRESIFLSPPSNFANLLDFSAKSENVEPSNSLESVDCVLCSPEAPCVCREVAEQMVASESQLLSFKNDAMDQQTMTLVAEQTHLSSMSDTQQPSILENLPPYQPPVPIRRRPHNTITNPVFPVSSLKRTSLPSLAQLSSSLNCSGDPANCAACADDSFGQAFCQAIGNSFASSSESCRDCPHQPNNTIVTQISDGSLVLGCCGDINKCGGCGIAPLSLPPENQYPSEIVSTDDAWRQIKSHPNVAFGDLTLLAEVVARRSKCVGPQVVIADAPQPPMQERADGSADMRPEYHSVMLTDPHEHYNQKQHERSSRDSPLRLVPQEILIECGRRRMRQVNADGVREALRLLDHKFARP